MDPEVLTLKDIDKLVEREALMLRDGDTFVAVDSVSLIERETLGDSETLMLRDGDTLVEAD